jgi:RNA polymerase sigma-70 factor (ECF subfamily)
MTLGEENNWLRLVAAGNERAFRSLYDEHAGMVYALAFSYLKSSLGAQDVVQEVFLKIWEKRSDLPSVNNFPGWLRILTRNYLINSLRKKIPAAFQEDISRLEFAEKGLPPSGQLDYKEMAGIIRQAVSALPPRQQQVYKLSREKDLTLNEIASGLGISYNTVREHMTAALKSIRAFLEQHYGEIGLLFWILFRH